MEFFILLTSEVKNARKKTHLDDTVSSLFQTVHGVLNTEKQPIRIGASKVLSLSLRACRSRNAVCARVSPLSTVPPGNLNSPGYRIIAFFAGELRNQFTTSLCPISTSHPVGGARAAARRRACRKLTVVAASKTVTITKRLGFGCSVANGNGGKGRSSEAPKMTDDAKTTAHIAQLDWRTRQLS